ARTLLAAIQAAGCINPNAASTGQSQLYDLRLGVGAQLGRTAQIARRAIGAVRAPIGAEEQVFSVVAQEPKLNTMLAVVRVSVFLRSGSTSVLWRTAKPSLSASR